MEEQYKGYNIKIEQDEDIESPREWENLGTLVCTHKRYELGDKHEINFNDFNSWNDVEKHLAKEHNASIILPVYLYDHSGLRIKVGDFHGLLPQGHAQFDSGQVGYIFVSAEKIKKEYSVKRISKALLKKVEAILRSEIKVYDDYLSGSVYYYSVDNVDSCGGYYGNDLEGNGLLDSARNAIDSHIEQVRKQKQAKTKAYLQHGVPLANRA